MKEVRQKMCFNCSYMTFVQYNEVCKGMCYLHDAATYDENLCDDYIRDEKIKEMVKSGKGWG